ncbi:hypothetical protein N7532_001831 [Penicillium argentinense]|uniref:Uncharacterized protein n=1 Tax=Penicillium argentinense TaxID=1131581 RepID=A0A9W9G392_9EURO|nr:uncharacterized protein N7532_001831 [Penicillium argentinense]KAJ5111296.1 hypothetical protein N7532_001831 [Penicillium argentinense]
MTSRFPSSDRYRAEISQMEEDAESHSHQNDIGGAHADMVCMIDELGVYIDKHEHDYCTEVTQSTQVPRLPDTHNITQGASEFRFCIEETKFLKKLSPTYTPGRVAWWIVQLPPELMVSAEEAIGTCVADYLWHVQTVKY